MSAHSPNRRPGLTQSSAEALGRLGDLLRHSGYGAFVSHFNLLAPDPAHWHSRRAAVPDGLKPLVDLFLLGLEVDANALPPELRILSPDLYDLGILIPAPGGGVASGGLVTLSILGNLLICDPPQADADFYIGDDTIALLTRMMPVAGGEALDLCAGPGLHALHSARFSRHVVAVELNPAAAHLARLNGDLNRLDERLEVLEGDLYAPLAGRRFDNVTANPPWLPYPPDLRPPAIGHGGSDGLAVTWRILEGLPAILLDNGVAQLVGMTWSDGRIPLARERFAALARTTGLDLHIAVLSHIPLEGESAYSGQWLRTICAVSGEGVAASQAAMMALIAEAKATHLCAFYLDARIGKGRLVLNDLSGGQGASIWHV